MQICQQLKFNVKDQTMMQSNKGFKRKSKSKCKTTKKNQGLPRQKKIFRQMTC